MSQNHLPSGGEFASFENFIEKEKFL